MFASIKDVKALATRIAHEFVSVRSALKQKAPVRRPVKGTDFPSYTLLPEDANTILVSGSSAGLTTITLPAGIFSEGDTIDVIGLGGQVTFVGGPGLILSPDLPITLTEQYSAATVV